MTVDEILREDRGTSDELEVLEGVLMFPADLTDDERAKVKARILEIRRDRMRASKKARN